MKKIPNSKIQDVEILTEIRNVKSIVNRFKKIKGHEKKLSETYINTVIERKSGGRMHNIFYENGIYYYQYAGMMNYDDHLKNEGLMLKDKTPIKLPVVEIYTNQGLRKKKINQLNN